MKAMILAAGRGERMRPLTDHTPKPLLEAGGKPLIGWHIERLVAAGISEIVVNCAWLAHQLQAALGDGRRFNARLHWSVEAKALETAGGIARALPLLGSEPFLVVNGDIWCDWDFCRAASCAQHMKQGGALAWLLMVDNPAHHPEGDFELNDSGQLGQRMNNGRSFTFSGIGVYDPQLFAALDPAQRAPLAPLLRGAMARRQVIGEHYKGMWMDIGTPERLRTLDEHLKQ